MKRKDDPQIKAAQWFLSFLNDNLNDMPALDLSKRMLEAEYYFSAHWSISEDHFRLMMKWVLSDPPKNIQPSKDILKVVQLGLKKIVQKIIETNSRIECEKGSFWYPIIEGKTSFEFFMSENKMCIDFIPRKRMKELFQNPRAWMDLARISFLSVLDGLPNNAIESCKECGKYFLRISEKPKYFCTPQCGSRFTNRERRKDKSSPEYKEYLAKQREIAKRGYRKKKADERGVSPDKVKIQKRSPSKERKNSS